MVEGKTSSAGALLLSGRYALSVVAAAEERDVGDGVGVNASAGPAVVKHIRAHTAVGDDRTVEQGGGMDGDTWLGRWREARRRGMKERRLRRGSYMFPAASYALTRVKAVSAAWLDERQLRVRGGAAGMGMGMTSSVALIGSSVDSCSGSSVWVSAIEFVRVAFAHVISLSHVAAHAVESVGYIRRMRSLLEGIGLHGRSELGDITTHTIAHGIIGAYFKIMSSPVGAGFSRSRFGVGWGTPGGAPIGQSRRPELREVETLGAKSPEESWTCNGRRVWFWLSVRDKFLIRLLWTRPTRLCSRFYDGKGGYILTTPFPKIRCQTGHAQESRGLSCLLKQAQKVKKGNASETMTQHQIDQALCTL
ncbi:hypothetical protein FB451DRAFT_1174870 [Mycena latifolia]|nr:hypothetical protein FB451DRAFT_1174870 [Mycena latifolia]